MLWENSLVRERLTMQDLLLFDMVRLVVEELNDLSDEMAGKSLSFDCHSLTRGFNRAFSSLQVVDGSFIGFHLEERESTLYIKPISMTHSWLRTPDGAIIDVYPPGLHTPTPILVPTEGRVAQFGGSHYLPDASVTSGFQKAKLRRKAIVLHELILRVAEKLDKEVKETKKSPSKKKKTKKVSARLFF